MQAILSHVNLDFDGLASMLAAKKLYPDASMVVTDKLNPAVRSFLAVYRDRMDLLAHHAVAWEEVTHLIVVDTASPARLGIDMSRLRMQRLHVTLYDHHPPKPDDMAAHRAKIEAVGAAVTLLLEEIRSRHIPVTPFEATLFGLGLYTDTGSFTYTSTTPRDLDAARWLLERGMDLELVSRFEEAAGDREQRDLFRHLFIHAEEHAVDGAAVVIGTCKLPKFRSGLSVQARKLLEATEADAALVVAEMEDRVYIVGRAASDRIHFAALMSQFGGGGHAQAFSAAVKKAKLEDVAGLVRERLSAIVAPAVRAADMMSRPVRSVAPDTTVEEASRLLVQYGHSGFPVVEEGRMTGLISRKDIDKAMRRHYGHAPVKAYMSANVISVHPDASVEDILQLMIKHDIGRLPVVEEGRLVGIVTRSNVIEVLHRSKRQTMPSSAASSAAASSSAALPLSPALPPPIPPSVSAPPAAPPPPV